MVPILVLVVVAILLALITVTAFNWNPELKRRADRLDIENRKLRDLALGLYDTAKTRQDVDELSADYVASVEAAFGTEYLRTRQTGLGHSRDKRKGVAS